MGMSCVIAAVVDRDPPDANQHIEAYDRKESAATRGLSRRFTPCPRAVTVFNHVHAGDDRNVTDDNSFVSRTMPLFASAMVSLSPAIRNLKQVNGMSP